jgi:hypothetical protein
MIVLKEFRILKEDNKNRIRNQGRTTRRIRGNGN